MIPQITKSLLEPHLNQSFSVQYSDSEKIELKLIEIEDDSKGQNELFWFIFEGPATPQLTQQIYYMQHAELEDLEIFLVPVVSPDKTTMNYQALFNRIKTDE